MVEFIEHLSNFIVKPTHPCEACDANYAKSAEINLETQKIIYLYAKLKKNAILFDSTSGWRQEWFVPEFWDAMQAGKS